MSSSAQLSKPLLSALDKDTIVAGLSVVAFVSLCKLYNIFLSHPKEYFSDLAIAKLAILGVLACALTRACVTVLFEQSLDVTSVLTEKMVSMRTQETPSITTQSPQHVPKLTRLVR